MISLKANIFVTWFLTINSSRSPIMLDGDMSKKGNEKESGLLSYQKQDGMSKLAQLCREAYPLPLCLFSLVVMGLLRHRCVCPCVVSTCRHLMLQCFLTVSVLRKPSLQAAGQKTSGNRSCAKVKPSLPSPYSRIEVDLRTETGRTFWTLFSKKIEHSIGSV